MRQCRRAFAARYGAVVGVSCVAVLSVRNEEQHLRRILRDLIHDGLDVAVIDNGSTDASAKIAEEHLGDGVMLVEQLPHEGSMDLTAQLVAKAALIERLDHDWVVHVDADEWLQSPRAGESLREGIARTSASGYNAINFEEFVFLPAPEGEAVAAVYTRTTLNYYFFAPQPARLMRAWDRRAGLDNIAGAGHLLHGDGLRLSPEAFLLRHYIVLSHAHAVDKYASRTFAAHDLARGWHGNRLGLTAERLQIPEAGLKTLPSWDSRDFDRSDPKATHYWDWA